jgi:hypothetical protein
MKIEQLLLLCSDVSNVDLTQGAPPMKSITVDVFNKDNEVKKVY